jgi:hypothetical protein
LGIDIDDGGFRPVVSQHDSNGQFENSGVAGVLRRRQGEQPFARGLETRHVEVNYY